ncbi:MAG: cyclic nucleotide-binding domain-containing protein, partial [Proteobacteria bacterium]|nr:cyclic nucleotide-binding domain-containing protein [Pseudomonadota bacterium]
ISSGEVRVDIKPEPQQLKSGDFFGEIALLKETDRTATVTAVTECQLLVLSADAFNRLLTGHPEMRDILTEVMEERLTELEESA